MKASTVFSILLFIYLFIYFLLTTHTAQVLTAVYSTL